jgi:hypothetical protein
MKGREGISEEWVLNLSFFAALRMTNKERCVR